MTAPVLLDREFQHHLLSHLAAIYPKSVDPRRNFWTKGSAHLNFNATYLHEHGLISGEWGHGTPDPIPFSVKATAKGVDFLSGDGGLSAVLSVVTVKLHEDTIKALLIKRVEESDADEGVKQSLVKKLKGLPAEAMQQITLQALEKGLQSLPDIIPWLLKSSSLS